MDLACPVKDATEISSDADHPTKVAPTTLSKSNQSTPSLNKINRPDQAAPSFRTFHLYDHNYNAKVNLSTTSGEL